MKISKPRKEKMLLFLGGIVLILVGTFSFRYYFTHTLPHPTPDPSPKVSEAPRHPHEAHPSDTVPKQKRDVSAAKETVEASSEPDASAGDTDEKSVEAVPKRRKLGKKGILAAFQPALRLKDSDRALAIEKMHEIAKELGEGDPEWTEYFHLEGHTLFNQLADRNQSYLSVADAVRYLELKEQFFGLTDVQEKELQEGRAAVRWNQDGPEVVRQIEPIIFIRRWMKENAPAEWDLVNTRYFELIDERKAPPPLADNFMTIRERVDLHYQNFTEALELLPEDSVTLSTLYESSHENATDSLSSEHSKVPPAPQSPSVPPKHTADVLHEPKPPPGGEKRVEGQEVQEDPREAFSKLLFPGSEKATDFEKRLTHSLRSDFSGERLTRALETLQRHGPLEGLRRVQEKDPEIASELESLFKQR